MLLSRLGFRRFGFPRFGFAIVFALCSIAPGLVSTSASAGGFPERDITFIIPNQVGGGFDAYVRAIAPVMEKYLPNKVNVVPLNVPAGGGAKGVNQLYRARPDGYTIGILNIPGLFILQARGGGYDLNKFTWLAGLGRDPYGLAVPWNSPIKSVADLKALSATRPVKFTTTGPDGTAYGVTMVATELLGIKLQLITGYKGSSEYVAAAVRGDGDAVITNLPILERFEAGPVAPPHRELYDRRHAARPSQRHGAWASRSSPTSWWRGWWRRRRTCPPTSRKSWSRRSTRRSRIRPWSRCRRSPAWGSRCSRPRRSPPTCMRKRIFSTSGANTWCRTDCAPR